MEICQHSSNRYDRLFQHGSVYLQWGGDNWARPPTTSSCEHFWGTDLGCHCPVIRNQLVQVRSMGLGPGLVGNSHSCLFSMCLLGPAEPRGGGLRGPQSQPGMTQGLALGLALGADTRIRSLRAPGHPCTSCWVGNRKCVNKL